MPTRIRLVAILIPFPFKVHSCRSSTPQRLTIRDPNGLSIQPSRHGFCGVIDGAQQFAGDVPKVGRQRHGRQKPQRMIGRQRLGVMGVQPRSGDPSGLERSDKRFRLGARDWRA
jgi:hypothetical protein